MCPIFHTTVSPESSTIVILDQLCWRCWEEGDVPPEGLCGREGWRSILLGGTGWVEEIWVLGLLWVLGNLYELESLRDDWFWNPINTLKQSFPWLGGDTVVDIWSSGVYELGGTSLVYIQLVSSFINISAICCDIIICV
jgi:hypothetical protein